jgi:nondiscriminating aspartyl-tRNA synthetase
MIKDQIIKILKDNNFDYKYMEHEETPTSADAARVRGTKLEEGAKAIILKGRKSGGNYMVALPGHLKIDIRALEKKLKVDTGIKIELTFEDPNIILERYGLIIGGIPPFGELLGIETFYDIKIFENEKMDFNCGERTASIEMKTIDYKKLIDNSKIGIFSK